ncbi:PTS lactose/cellobiose transporter subunit IIA [Lactobacillus paragasseri]|uniref:PTS system lactose-specific EIIA component n=1 Tax=Lactobacillus paragasseri TaxID=2107999 RepID=A0ABD5A199_9LACO|nr:PTS lactose/cellobiose transporter subunit IIA [Lactobacillus paragasseri]MDK7952846.1 PTS lactose/cellobiose transporter subunit IIA [Lactobacillus paragasseri]MDO6361483.1 PTS lactose/cellobiose transporter subunit IIA [Lactobacillus paragasseri]MDX5059815.1 PTS lactose/cellobiose transporter subunit IIA [Lactobacillus paragasseri]
MVSKEEISMVGFTIVAYAGDAKTDLLNALKLAREGKFEKAEKLIEDANNSLVDAHNAQTKLMSQEANGEELETTFIMSHGQDTLMTTMLLRDEVKYFIDLYKQNLALRAEIEQLKEEMN